MVVLKLSPRPPNNNFDVMITQSYDTNEDTNTPPMMTSRNSSPEIKSKPMAGISAKMAHEAAMKFWDLKSNLTVRTSERINAWIGHIELQEGDFQTAHSIRTAIQQAARWVKCTSSDGQTSYDSSVKISTHGSVRTGVALFDSDLDFCVITGAVLSISKRNQIPVKIAVVQYLQELRKVLNHAKLPISRVEIHEGVGIIKIHFNGCNFTADITTHAEGLRSTALLRLLYSYYPKAKYLVKFLKTFFDSNGMRNTENVKNRLKSFTIQMLAVYYLIHAGLIKMPTAAQLEFCAKAPVADVDEDLDKWDSSVVGSLSTIRKRVDHLASIPIFVLIYGFFEFYASFDFTERGISLIDEWKKSYGLMTVIDPLVVWKNVGRIQEPVLSEVNSLFRVTRNLIRSFGLASNVDDFLRDVLMVRLPLIYPRKLFGIVIRIRFTNVLAGNNVLRCKYTGHLAKDCPNLNTHQRCYLCKAIDHLYKECPFLPLSVEESQGVLQFCFKCMSEGHVVAECSKRCYDKLGRHGKNLLNSSNTLLVLSS
uniref:CCHC-type domain-containing protein n=1 Tax=Ditylenchus dipsaci TaxID=166011 RepID=A0A915EG91_9BILA